MPMPEARSEPLLQGQNAVSSSTQSRTMTLRERVGSLAQRAGDRGGSFIQIAREVYETEKQEVCYYGLKWGCCAGVIVIINLAVAGWFTVPEEKLFVCGDKQMNVETIQKFSAESKSLVAVNLGGWLCLEDWFHSGSVGRYVSTPDQINRGQGACLPPLLTGPLDEPWPSEGILVNRTSSENSEDYAAEVFKAFREDFVTEKDFEQIASLGIKTIRIPFSWSMFADALAPIDQKLYGSHDPDIESRVVPDPYYTNDIKMVTIPRKWFKGMLEKAAKHGLKVILDLHNMVGGSSDGTYSGVWPMKPVFWQENSKFGGGTAPLQKIGLMIAEALVKFIEVDLKDLVEEGVIWGVCFMNEPAHLSGIHAKWGAFANSTQVLDFVDLYSNLFRNSQLPGKGIRLYIQLIETAWATADDFDEQVPVWYHNSFTDKERYSWAVIARHFYTAWGCNGMITQGASYQCDDSIDKIKSILHPCIGPFAKGFADKFHGLRAVTEWSLGSHWDANVACSNDDVLRALFEANVGAFADIDPENQIEPVFWSWKMPYGPKFQPGWSLKSFSGMDESSDSNGRCLVGSWASESPLDG